MKSFGILVAAAALTSGCAVYPDDTPVSGGYYGEPDEYYGGPIVRPDIYLGLGGGGYYGRSRYYNPGWRNDYRDRPVHGEHRQSPSPKPGAVQTPAPHATPPGAPTGGPRGHQSGTGGQSPRHGRGGGDGPR